MSTTSGLQSIFIGSQSLLIQCIRTYLDKGQGVAAILSDDVQVQSWAREQGLNCLPTDADPATLPACEYLFSIVHLALIPEALLELPHRAAINFHDGPLPDYAGLNVTAWAILEGESQHAISWHEMTTEVDAGDVLKTRQFPISKDETALSLNAKAYDAALESFEALVDDLISGQLERRPQDLSKRRYFAKAKRPEAAASIDWRASAESISRLVRGLNFGPYPNALSVPKIWLERGAVRVEQIDILPSESILPAGTVTHVSDRGLTVATGTFDVSLSGFRELGGAALDIQDLRLEEGAKLRLLSEEERSEIDAYQRRWSKHEGFWRSRLETLSPLELAYAARRQDEAPSWKSRTITVNRTSLGVADARTELSAVLALYLSRLSDSTSLDLPFVLEEHHPLYAARVPLRLELEAATVGELVSRTAQALSLLRRRGSYARDLLQRYELSEAQRWQDEAPQVALSFTQAGVKRADADLTLFVPEDGQSLTWHYRNDVYDEATLTRMQAQVEALLARITEAGQALKDLTIVSENETERLARWNQTAASYDRAACVHQLFEKQAAETPEKTALVYEGESLSYADLDRRANQLARALAERGVGSGDFVGVLMARSLDLVVGLFAIFKAGAAYVPLDPSYPKDRLAYMAEDAGLKLILSQSRYADFLPDQKADFVAFDGLELDSYPATAPEVAVSPDDLAYMIYTSGSTGKPKGVMVAHRNVVNFFVGMDERLGTEPGVWLAVTSISFDISVLELFWTLARGFKVVLYAGDVQQSAGASARDIDFSLYYFASDAGEKAGRDKYKLLLEGAKFADEQGFLAVWTPERHFHAFGGLYPNPSVISAAIAATTERVQIRAGSCVLPLHSPIRIAEEWALVDNLSDGRVGLSFATGWQPNDFVIKPETFDTRHATFAEDIETVRALWRGEARSFKGPKGETDISTLPRPVQEELPFWVTAAGNPETFRRAGAMGANMLTHLLGQSVDDLAEKLRLYHQAWDEAGHEGRGQVTLMLHSFVGDDEAFVREQVHEPLKNYLRSATNLVKQYASSFPAFKNANREGVDDIFDHLSDEDMEALLEHAFERYYATSGLFGTPERCLDLVNKLKGVGIDEIACLIDFGVPSDLVLEHLPYLSTLKEQSGAATVPHIPFEDLMQTHEVSHLQCTPSMATMLSKTPTTRRTLEQLELMMVGGEAFPSELAEDLHGLVGGRVLNMYGPTETTIWSATHEVEGDGLNVPIGKPIANTQIYIVDAHLRPLPTGIPGELLIGGDGVVRGYHKRAELTAERFVQSPFEEENARLYRTGDLARWREDGVLEFLGRIDHQVKLRGHRIELGEIEAALAGAEGVQQNVVIAREDTPGDKYLAAYLILESGHTLDASKLKRFLKTSLPDIMVPTSFTALETFPLTPNKKVDRKRLPAPDKTRAATSEAYVPPRNPTEEAVAEFFADVLGLERVGIHDNFLELGGDSLAAVEIFVNIQQRFEVEFPLYMFFQVPTVAGLAEKLDEATAKKDDEDDIEFLIKHY